MKIGEQKRLEVYGEICCEVCNEIIHNHFNCPVCGKFYAPSANYEYLENEDILACELCGAKFKLIGEGWYLDAMAEYVGKK
jgi:transcription elongation factor Elf1